MIKNRTQKNVFDVDQGSIAENEHKQVYLMKNK